MTQAFLGQADSTGAFNGLEALNPSSFGVRGVIGKKAMQGGGGGGYRDRAAHLLVLPPLLP
jgi:hypothetical protein